MRVRWSSFLASMRGPGVALALAAAALTSAGCDRTACVQWSESRGSCPSQEEALAYLTPTCDVQHVRKVLSDGEFADGLCCYDVEAASSDTYVCGEFAQGIDDRAPPPPTSTASSSSGQPACIGCSAAISGAWADLSQLCTGSAKLYENLVGCICVDACADECFDSTCSGFSATGACSDCLLAGCSPEIEQCLSDP